MNNLVISKNDQALTTSRNVARDFDKNHQHVLRDIDRLKEDVQNWTDLFYETTYTHEQNKQEYRQYLINKDGFTLLAMGFTGKQAMKFKVDYMNAFNEMEKQIQKPSNTKLLLKTALQHEEQIEEIKTDVSMLKNTMRIDGVQEFRLRKRANQVVVKSLGGKESPAYKNLSSKVFSRFWRDFKEHFMIPRYGELPKVQFEEGINFINVWQPDTSTRLEIQSINNQQVMRGVI